jgi:circadian clock protein KaiB
VKASGGRASQALRRRVSIKMPRVSFRLYVAGTSPRSLRAIQNARAICDEHFQGRHELEVIDIFQQPGRAKDDQILAVPTLIKRTPPPLQRFIGDLSDRLLVLAGLNIRGDTP